MASKSSISNPYLSQTNDFPGHVILLPQLTLAKHKNELMGMMVMESGYGSAIPACVVVHLSKTGAATRSGLLNVGDHIISINGVNLVGMPRRACIDQIKVRESHNQFAEMVTHNLVYTVQ